MARKLLCGNDVISFNPGTGTIVVKGFVPIYKLLLINNATKNTAIYNFSDQNNTATVTHDYVNNTTTIDVSSNISSMDENDEIQVFYEKEDLEIKPTRTYRDPVSKLRVSNPQTLIDTDFEYGLQPTKWETLKLINNVPTTYASQSSDEAIVISSIKLSGDQSDLVIVDTESPHELTAGSVVEIVGLSDPKYEGVFLVKSISDSNTFTYKLPFVSEFKDLKTIYSLVYPGSFYTGSALKVSDIRTDNAQPTSSLDVDTSYVNGFNPTTKLYLKKSRAIKRFRFNSPENVVGTAVTVYQSQINGNGGSPLTQQIYRQKMNFDDFQGNHEIYVDTTDFSFDATGDISYRLSEQEIAPGNNTPLISGDIIIFYTQIGNTLPSPLAEFIPYRVFDVRRSGTNNDIVTFKISALYTPTTAVQFTSGQGTTTFGKHRIIKGTKITRVTANDTVTALPPTGGAHGFRNNDQVILATNLTSGLRNFVRSRNNGQETPNYRIYKVSSVKGNTFRLNQNPNNGTNTLNFASDNNIALFRITYPTARNSVYIPPQVGFSTAPFEDGQLVTYSISGTNAVAIGGLTNGTNYLLKKVGNSFPNWYRIYPLTDILLSGRINLSATSATADRLFVNTTHTFTSTVNRKDAHTIQIISPPRGELSNNAIIRYSAEAGVSLIGGLAGDIDYRVKTTDSLIGDSTKLRLSTTSSTAKIWSSSYKANATTARINIVASPTTSTLVAIGVTRVGQLMQVTGFNNPSPTANNIFNGLQVVTAIGATTRVGTTRNYFVPITVRVDDTKNKALSFTIARTNTATLSNTAVCGITSFTDIGGIGTHFISQPNPGAVDDIYDIKEIDTENSFSFNTLNEIPEISLNFSPSDVTTGVSGCIRIPNHYFADGVTVTYTVAGGATEIGGLTSGENYYIRVLDSNFVSLCATPEEAQDRENGQVIEFTSQGTGAVGSHNFTTDSVIGWIPGAGTVAISTESNVVTGIVSTRFLSDFSNGDVFRVYTTGVSPGSYFESKIISINNDRILKLQDIPEFTNSSANYFIPTTLYAISNGKAVHKPFDGGVNMSTGLSPNSQVIRQTRKYFRYQSGKGIQVSMAVNFNPTFDINDISLVGTGATSYLEISCREPHQLSPDSVDSDQKISFSGINGSSADILNNSGPFTIVNVNSDFNFQIDAGVNIDSVNDITGFPQYNVVDWVDSSIKAGMFDDQNGFYFEYDGTTLFACRRSSTQQIAGSSFVRRGSNKVSGVNTRYSDQISVGDKIIIRGQTYKVTNVYDNNLMDVQPSYRGADANDVTISKIIDTKVPQSEWNLDRMDGTGESGYNLDINKIQMIYMDYSWYGAGTIRFGFKDTIGEVKYCHEFYHNNIFTESYMRSGNVPARYEVETFDSPLFAPSLFHWGVSIIMDGRFDDDKAYLFTAESKSLPFTNGGITANFTGTGTAGQRVISGIQFAEFNNGMSIGETIIQTNGLSNIIQSGTLIESIEVDPASRTGNNPNYILNISKPLLVNLTTGTTLNCISGTANDLKRFHPLVSIRLSPSVDNANGANLGFRDIINRMQLVLKSAGVLATHDCEVRLILNPRLSNDVYSAVGSPSLSQIYRHSVGESLSDGTVVLAFRAQGGSILDNTNGRRSFNVTDVTLDEIALLGNSILGGDGIFPDGPDVLTLAVKPVDTSQIRGSAPFIATGRVTWAESQA